MSTNIDNIILDMVKILQLVVMAFGVKELYHALESINRRKRNGGSHLYLWVFLPVSVPLFR